MLHPGKPGDTGGEEPVPVGILRGQQAVGGHQDGPVEFLEFTFLLIPRTPVVSRKMIMLLERRIVMSRQHFAVRIHINSRVLGLLKQLLQILQVMTGNQDARLVSNPQIYLGNLRMTISPGIGTVQKRHYLDGGFPGIKHLANHFIHTQLLGGRCQVIGQLPVNLVILCTQS